MNSIQKFEMWLDDMDNRLEEANKAGVPLIVEDMKKEKYPHGYWSKIDYWTHKLNTATVTDDIPAVKLALSKLNYFVQRQEEVYGG